MTAISTKVKTIETHLYAGPPQLHAADYREKDLYEREFSDVRSYAEVLKDNYGPEGEAWEYVITEPTQRLGKILLHADGVANYYEKYGPKVTE